MILYDVFKRIGDLVIASAALLILSPVLILLGILIRFKLGAPIFFRQNRPGWRGRTFEMIKFRTMKDLKNPAGIFLPDVQRLTPFGRLLRATSLDELPELWNVVRGDMSLVGPRPLLTKYMSLYTPAQIRRHDVRPGLTGWAQVHGRNAQTWTDRFRLDIWYVDNRSFWLDVKILFLTLKTVFKSEGITAHGHATMPEFDGSAEA